MKSCISGTKNQFKYTNFFKNVFDFVEELQLHVTGEGKLWNKDSEISVWMLNS